MAANSFYARCLQLRELQMVCSKRNVDSFCWIPLRSCRKTAPVGSALGDNRVQRATTEWNLSMLAWLGSFWPTSLAGDLFEVPLFHTQVNPQNPGLLPTWGHKTEPNPKPDIPSAVRRRSFRTNWRQASVCHETSPFGVEGRSFLGER